MSTALHITPDMIPGMFAAIVLLPILIVVVASWVGMLKR